MTLDKLDLERYCKAQERVNRLKGRLSGGGAVITGLNLTLLLHFVAGPPITQWGAVVVSSLTAVLAIYLSFPRREDM